MIERLDNVEPRVLRLAVYCTILIVVAALVSRSTVPDIKNYLRIAHAHSVLMKAARNETGLAGEISNIRQEVGALEARVSGDMASLPEQQMESFIIDRLQAISWRNNIELGALTPSSGTGTKEYREMLFQVELSGSYFQMVDWLGDLASELGFVVVREQQITLKQSGTRKPELVARLSLAAYRLAGLD